jgi:hypothetical protein
MKKCILTAFTNPIAGREVEYNEWYDHQHLKDVLTAPGFKSAQRFVVADDTESRWKYLAIYEFEGDDPNELVAGLVVRAGTAAMVISQALDAEASVATSWISIGAKLVRDT